MTFIAAKIESVDTDNALYQTQQFQRGDTRFVMSSSQLKEFARCPARWRNGYESPPSDAKEFGSLLDCLVLTPDSFKTRFAVEPATYKNEKGEEKPWNNNAKVCQAWNAEQIGKEVISSKEKAMGVQAAKRLREDDVLSQFMDESEKQVYLTGQWQDKNTDLVVPVKCLIDLAPKKETEFAKCLADLKTTRNGSVIVFQRQCYQMGWHIQAAWDLDMYVKATDEDRNTWCFVIQENYQPWQPGKRMLSQDFLNLGRAAYESAMANYCWCLKNNVWPGYDDTDEAIQGWSLVAPEPWMEQSEIFKPKFETDPEAEPEPEDINV